MRNNRGLLTGLLLLLISGFFLWPILTNWPVFMTRFEPDYWQGRYENSQWALGFAATEQMGDADLYAFGGYRQWQGDDPTLINPEQPPMGKYLLGLSIFLTGNPLWINLVLGLGSLGLVWLISRQYLKDSLLSLIPVLLLVSDRIFQENLPTSMLDLPFLFFLLLFFWAIKEGERKKEWYLLGLISLSLASATKMYLAGFGLLAATCLLMFFKLLTNKKGNEKWFFAFLPFFGLAYLAAFAAYFTHGHTLGEFKYYHFWVRHFARVRVEGYPKGEIWRLFLTGWWRIWWPENSGFPLIRYKKWSLLWPVSFGSLAVYSLRFFKKINQSGLILVFWAASILGMYTLGVPYPRYLLPLLPPLYIIIVLVVKEVWVRGQLSRQTRS